jgi:hypothetical protein
MTTNYKTGLTIRQIQSLPVFASVSSVEAACNLVGISRNCFYEWLKQPQFKEELQKLRCELVEGATLELKINSKKAVSTLVKLLDNDQHPAVQRSAANDILNQVVKFKELMELEQRISTLEQQLKPV